MKQLSIDFDRLMKLRLLIARFGEMDMARWWNTNSLLGKHGKIAISRGFPKTHYFVQANIVMAVAGKRCEELFNPPDSINLWNLPAIIENIFAGFRRDSLDRTDEWAPFFEALSGMTKDNLIDAMKTFGIISESQIESTEKLRRSAGGRAVRIARSLPLSDDLITLLAAGFAKSEPGSPAIPYILKDDIA